MTARFPHDRVRVQDWGAFAYASEAALPAQPIDSAPAIQEAIRALTDPNAIGVSRDAYVIALPPGVYWCGSTIRLDASVKLMGAGVRTTVLLFPKDTDGLVIDRASTSGTARDGSDACVTGLHVRAQSGGVSGNGITAYATCRIVDVLVTKFGGHGVLLSGDLTSQPPTNVSTSQLNAVRVGDGIGGDGIRIEGGDANACTIISCRASACGGIGFHDRSLLGNQWISCMEENSGGGSYVATSQAGYPTFVGCYVEGDPPARPPSLAGSCTTVVGGNLAFWLDGQDLQIVGGRKSRQAFARHSGEDYSILSLPGSEGPLSMQSRMGGDEAQYQLHHYGTPPQGMGGPRNAIAWRRYAAGHVGIWWAPTPAHPVYEADQFAFSAPLADTAQHATERLTATLQPGEVREFAFRGSEPQNTEIGVVFAHPGGDYVAHIDLRSDVDGPLIVRRWHDAGTRKYRVRVRNDAQTPAAVELIGQFFARCRYK